MDKNPWWIGNHIPSSHFSFLLSEEELILEVQRSAKIIPYRIEFHPRRALRSPAEAGKLLESNGSIKIDSRIIPLTPLPRNQHPQKRREEGGGEWEMSLWLSKEKRTKTHPDHPKYDLNQAGKCEEFPKVPTFWCSNHKLISPKSLEIKQGVNSRIFDPIRKNEEDYPTIRGTTLQKKEQSEMFHQT